MNIGLYHFFNNSQSSQENKNGLGLSSLKMNSRLSINNIGFSSIKGSESQPVSKYGKTLSFCQNQSQKDINNSWPIGANNRSIKSFKDIDLIKNRVLNSSVVGSDKVIVDSVIQCIKFFQFQFIYSCDFWFFDLIFLFFFVTKKKRNNQ